VTHRLLPYFLYLAGSLFFVLGTLVAIYQIVRGR